MGKYVLSPEAQNSLREIKHYSLKNFGKRQTTIYLKKIQIFFYVRVVSIKTISVK